MLIHINSNYRNKNLYPYPSNFIIPNNSIPFHLSNDSFIDDRINLITKDSILFSFIYNQEIDIIYDILDSDTILIQLPIINEINPEFYLFFQNILIGYIIKDENNQSIITFSNIQENGILCNLENNIFHNSNKLEKKNGKLYNPSNSLFSDYSNNIIINGFSKYNFVSSISDLQNNGISKDCILINLTQEKYSKIIDIFKPYKNVIISPSIYFNNNDYIIVMNDYSNNNIYISTILEYYPRGCKKFHIHLINEFIPENTLFYNREYNFEIIYKKKRFIIIKPGFFLNPISITIFSDLNIELKIDILEIQFCFHTNSVPPLNKYLMFWLIKNSAIPIYSNVLEINNEYNIIYTEYPSIIYNDSKNYNDLYEKIGFMIIENFIPSLINPISNINVNKCYNVQLISLTLPNKSVCGVNQLLAYFPYVLVNFGNSTNSSIDKDIYIHNSTTSIGSLISNIPSAQNASFICPIANIRNPEINQYVVILSSQIIQMKLNLSQDLYFSVFLQSGKILIFSSAFSISSSIDHIESSNICKNNSQLNPNNYTHVYTQNDDIFISATFLIEPIL